MLSYFTVCAEDSIFEINEQEWNAAIKEHPELDESQNQMSFFNRTASAWIEPGKDCYFNNEDILYQFERLFKLLKFKKAYENFEVEILVDNARTHTSKLYDLNNLNKHSSIKSSFYETIEYMENNENKVSECHFMDPNDGLKKSKGLFIIAKELKLIEPCAETRDKRYSLPNLRQILSHHAAFSSISKLENLARKYNVKIIFVPKFHCELSPVEGFWCFSKDHVRKYNDQNYETMKHLINEAIAIYKDEKHCLNSKLWNRF